MAGLFPFLYLALYLGSTRPPDSWHSMASGRRAVYLIMGHPWLPRPSTFQPLVAPVSLRGDTPVASLFTASKEWNETMIRAEFRRDDAKCILNIPLSATDRKDSIIWHFEEKGCFTVKTTYRLVCAMREEGSCSQLGRSWKFIWGSKAPPKVILFAWKCAMDALPTTVNLENFARLVWAISGLPWKALSCSVVDTEDWLRRVFWELDRREWDFFLCVCWGL
ncbi:UNVERIFIED_CONTAM: hypothetical protein Slati_1893600 [Sesamum latifolium]|uniref:Reverse transcriptase zinc-binding domain-containing protein n=1 Tax=Sesamum latifolium TaxID=2727402 RepID=A0AAW2X0B7_9LAMI